MGQFLTKNCAVFKKPKFGVLKYVSLKSGVPRSVTASSYEGLARCLHQEVHLKLNTTDTFQSNANHLLAENMSYTKFEGI